MKDHTKKYTVATSYRFKPSLKALSSSLSAILKKFCFPKILGMIGILLINSATQMAYAQYHPRHRYIPVKETIHPWAVTASIGYTAFQNAYKGEGQTAVGRLAFDYAFFDFESILLGAELGVQNGNSMQLDVSQSTLDELGGSPIQTTVKPILDLLATAKSLPIADSPFFAQIKGGIAYRRWQFDDRTSINFLSNIAGEVQAGVGLALNRITNLSLLYQGIYGGNPDFIVNSTNETGTINNIPIQNGVLLSLSVVV
ncbi:MAG TPA: hypothetical protein VHD33_00325 [Legionellaceae bacterium]|nr:hypothetical protein [Legionellaceae bacterium]